MSFGDLVVVAEGRRDDRGADAETVALVDTAAAGEDTADDDGKGRRSARPSVPPSTATSRRFALGTAGEKHTRRLRLPLPLPSVGASAEGGVDAVFMEGEVEERASRRNGTSPVRGQRAEGGPKRRSEAPTTGKYRPDPSPNPVSRPG